MLSNRFMCPSDHVQIVLPFKKNICPTSILPVKTTFKTTISRENMLCDNSLNREKRRSIVSEFTQRAKCQMTGNLICNQEVRFSPEKQPIQRTSGMAHGNQFEQDA